MMYGKDETIMVSGIDVWSGGPAYSGNGHARFFKGDFIEGRRNCPLDLHYHWNNYRPSPVDPGSDSLLFLHRNQFGDGFKEKESHRGSRRAGCSSRVQTTNR